MSSASRPSPTSCVGPALSGTGAQAVEGITDAHGGHLPALHDVFARALADDMADRFRDRVEFSPRSQGVRGQAREGEPHGRRSTTPRPLEPTLPLDEARPRTDAPRAEPARTLDVEREVVRSRKTSSSRMRRSNRRGRTAGPLGLGDPRPLDPGTSDPADLMDPRTVGLMAPWDPARASSVRSCGKFCRPRRPPRHRACPRLAARAGRFVGAALGSALVTPSPSAIVRSPSPASRRAENAAAPRLPSRERKAGRSSPGLCRPLADPDRRRCRPARPAPPRAGCAVLCWPGAFDAAGRASSSTVTAAATPATVRDLRAAAPGAPRARRLHDRRAPDRDHRGATVRHADRADGQDAAGCPARTEAPLAIESKPSGAVVFLDGRQVGTTPLTFPLVKVGAHAVRITLEGYRPWSSSVEVSATEPNRVTASLER